MKIHIPEKTIISCDICRKEITAMFSTWKISVPKDDFSGNIVAEQATTLHFCVPCHEKVSEFVENLR